MTLIEQACGQNLTPRTLETLQKGAGAGAG